MKVYRIIEYSIPADYTAAELDHLGRTLELSLHGPWQLGALTITAARLNSIDPEGTCIAALEQARKMKGTWPVMGNGQPDGDAGTTGNGGG